MGLLSNEVLAHLSGGDLNITVTEEGDELTAMMKGKAVTVYDAIMDVEL